MRWWDTGGGPNSGARWGSHFLPFTSRRVPPCFPRFPYYGLILSPTQPTPLHNAPRHRPRQTTKINSIASCWFPRCASWHPRTAPPDPFPIGPNRHMAIQPSPFQFARFLTSSTNPPCPFDSHDHRTIQPMRFDFPSLTPRGFSEIIATPPLSFEPSPSAFSGKDGRPQKHERGRQKRFPLR